MPLTKNRSCVKRFKPPRRMPTTVTVAVLSLSRLTTTPYLSNSLGTTIGAANILVFAIAVFLLVASLSPNGVLIAKTLPTSGRETAFINVASLRSADFLNGSPPNLGISLMLMRSVQALYIVKLLGAAYLDWPGV